MAKVLFLRVVLAAAEGLALMLCPSQWESTECLEPVYDIVELTHRECY